MHLLVLASAMRPAPPVAAPINVPRSAPPTMRYGYDRYERDDGFMRDIMEGMAGWNCYLHRMTVGARGRRGGDFHYGPSGGERYRDRSGYGSRNGDYGRYVYSGGGRGGYMSDYGGRDYYEDGPRGYGGRGGGYGGGYGGDRGYYYDGRRGYGRYDRGGYEGRIARTRPIFDREYDMMY